MLDYIEQRHLDGFTKKEIKVRLWEYMGELLEVSKLYIPVLKFYDEICKEVISLGPPSSKRIQKRVEQSKEMRNLGLLKFSRRKGSSHKYWSELYQETHKKKGKRSM